MNQCPLREMPAVSRVPPSPCAEPVEEYYGSVSAQLVGHALHQHRFAHSTCRMDHEGKTNLTGKDCDVVENRALHDFLDLGKCIRGRIQAILVLDFQLSQDCYPINTLICFAAGAGLNPDKIPQLEQALLRIWITGFAPCS